MLFRSEHLTCGIRCYPWIDSARTELCCRTPSWCPENCLLYVGSLSATPSPTHTQTMELGPRTQKRGLDVWLLSQIGLSSKHNSITNQLSWSLFFICEIGILNIPISGGSCKNCCQVFIVAPNTWYISLYFNNYFYS